MIIFRRIPGFGKFQSLERCKKRFSFIENMKQKLDEAHILVLADAAGALMRKMKDKIPKDFIKIALNGCKDLVQARGYQHISEDMMIKSIGSNYFNIIATCGCQTDLMLEKRVVSAAELNEKLLGKTKFFLSGSRPNLGGPASIPIEANEMVTKLYDYYDQKRNGNRRPELSDIHLDESSTNTEENIQKLLDFANELSKLEPSLANNKPNIFFCSSDFHLIKIADIFESKIQNTDDAGRTNIYLVGSEPINKLDKVSLLPEYIKSLFFQLHKSLLESKTFNN